MPVTWIILAAIVLLSVSGGPACLLSQRLGVLASLRLAGRYLPILRVFQQAQMQSCVLYVLTILIVQLVWGATGVQS